MRIGWTQDRPYRWVVWSTIVITSAGLVGAWWGLTTIDRRLIQAAEHSLSQTAADAAHKVDTLLEERWGDMAVLATTRILRSGDAGAITAHLEELRDAYGVYLTLLMADAHGRVVAGTDPDRIGADVSRAAWYRNAAQQAEAVMAEVRTAQDAAGEDAVMFAQAVRTEKGDVAGVVAGWVGLPVIRERMEESVGLLAHHWGEGVRIEYQLLAENGDLLADSELQQDARVNLRMLHVPSALAVARGESGSVVERHGRTNRQLVTGYAQTQGGVRIPNLKWGVLIRVPEAAVHAPISALLWKVGLGWWVIAMPMITLLLWSAKRLEQHGQEQQTRATTSEAALHLHIASLRSVVEAARALTEARDLDGLFQTLLELARRDTQAASAVIMLFDEAQGGVSRLISQGLPDEAVASIERSPIGKGLLERLTRDAQPIRLTDLGHHLVAMGFSAEPLPVSEFLGAPIRAHGRLYGALCLVDKADTQSVGGRFMEFTDLDEQVITALTAQAGVAVENLQALAHAQRQATHDSLTGLLNHSAILEALELELSRSHRTAESVSVLLLDLDHFKAVNDTYGHSAGDQVLIETANRIRGVLRPYDLTGRVGGEEFLLVLPKCGPAGAAHLADRLRRSIGEQPFSRAAGPFTVTASIGVTSWPGSLPTSPTLLVEVADEALYRAKRTGRNKVEVGTPRIGNFEEQRAS